MGALLEIENLTVWLATRRGPQKAVDSVSFHVDAGEIFGLAGESGSGKTMTAMALLGLLPHAARTSGRAVFDGRDLLSMSARQLRAVRGRHIAMVSQDPSTSLHPMLTVETQLTEHMRHHLGSGRSEARTRAVDLLTTVRIPDPERALSAHPAQFSGGMRQRIAIAVALACQPRLLLADEPTTALDVTVQAGILRLLDRLRREQDLAVMVITHDLGVMSAVTDRICVMYGGRLAEVGLRQDVLNQPRHPYTRGLLDALPHPEGGAAALRPIPGSPPPLGRVPEGCPFHPRCAFALPSCRTDRPVPVLVGEAHASACPPDPFGGAA
ncbi:ABC transporter ATP-binding protein [Micromonospora soli]|uniref:ABC transporter ATP-binding protein n=1 Tax=Micromonospora sp. NBRC 110009 TaxID=3061627 RepID=UPI002671C94A|nr:ABC transporter ATP-binding protein [Micromonospora sp. NBRC 110009]WKT98574.1 ABC transporter ATP-binding protein [Micromonospora sp. NBRC 110009]